MKWLYQETLIDWRMWAIGWCRVPGRGWRLSTLEIAFGPFRFCFIKDETL